MEIDKSESLLALINPHIEKPFRKLPKKLRQRVIEKFHPFNWDESTSERRVQIARLIDLQSEPARADEEALRWFKVFADIFEKESDIERYERMGDGGDVDKALKKDSKLKALHSELEELKSSLAHDFQSVIKEVPPTADRVNLDDELPQVVRNDELNVRNFTHPIGAPLQTPVAIHPHAPADAFLNPPEETDTQQAASAKQEQEEEEEEEIPGTLPRVAVGKLAVKAAWEIECEMKCKATDKEVMTLLQQWADNGDEPEILKKSAKTKRAVIWITRKSKEKEYSLEACQKTLEAWNKSRG